MASTGSTHDRWLQRMLDGLVDAGAPGALARFRDGQRAWDGGSGVAELGEPSPVEPTGWFRIGSLTKAFTATVVLQLVAEDVLHVDETVEDWLPSLVPRGDQITLNHLLRHTSGLSNYTDDLTDNGAVLHDRFRSWTPQETIEHATVKPALFKPGTSRSYSNTNYILLGLVIERSTGRSYEAEVERRILRPVGMDHTLVPGNDPALPEPHAHGYLMIADEPVDITAFNASHAWAAGGIVSTANDLNLFYAALLAGALLEPAGLRAMKTTVPTTSPDMTAGLGISRVVLPDGVPVWGNGGAFFGYSTWSFHTANADRQLTVSATTARGERPSTLDILTKAFCPADADL